MLISYKLGQDSIILRVKITDSSKNDNTGVISLTNTSVGLNISTIVDNEATPTVYKSSNSTIETITTLGVYVAPTATKCRFKQVDPNNHSGLYEIQIADTRYAVSNAKSILVTIAAITALNVAQSDSLIPLVRHDPYLPQPNHFELMDIDGAGWLSLQPSGLDNIFEDGFNLRQTIYVMAGILGGVCSGLPASPVTFKGLDSVTTRAVIAFDVNSNRLSSIITPP